MRSCRTTQGRDADAAREAILTAAEDVFARTGFSGARVDAIAEASGYNKSLIFHYFADKHGLYRAVVDRLKGQFEEESARLIAPLADPEAARDPQRVAEFIAEAVRWSFDFYVAHPQSMRIQMWEAAEGWSMYACLPPPPNRQRWPDAVREFLHRAQAAGVVCPEFDPTTLIANVMGITLMYHASIPRYELLFPGKRLSTPEALAHAREQLVAMVLHGIMTKTHSEEEANHAAGV